MSKPNRFITAVLLVLFTLSQPALAAGSPPPQGPSLAALAGGITPEALQSAAAGLPTNPGQAAMVLVSRIFGPDEQAADAAAAELLRRSGVPVVSADGPVIGLPDHYVLYDIPIYAGLIPTLTRAVRYGDFYTPDQLAQLLSVIGVTPDPLPLDVLVGSLGRWGKGPDTPPEIATAAAAIRALSAERGQVLYREADPAAIEIDPLQAALIIAHATSRVGTAKKGAGIQPEKPDLLAFLDWITGVQPARAAESGPCDDLKKASDQEGQVGNTIRQWTTNQIKDGWKSMLPGAVGEAIDKAGEAWDKGSAALSSILLMLGARLEIGDDHGGQTHFKHSEGEDSRNVTVAAVAWFDSAIAKEKLACYQLAGIDVPPSGPLKGFRIRWKMSQDVGTVGNTGYQGKYLAVVSADSDKLNDGEVTGDNGTSTLKLHPPVEKKPGEGKLRHGSVTVVASLDKDDFPFKLSDLLGLANVPAFTAGKLFDIVNSALTRAGLPSQKEVIRVEYHGADIYVAKGKATESGVFFYTSIPIYLDIYTCDGLDGLWKGTFTVQAVDKTDFITAMEQVFNIPHLPEGGKFNKDLSFYINPKATDAGFDIVRKFSGQMNIDKLPGENQHFDGVIGTAEILVDGGAIPDTWLTQSLKVPLKGVPEDDRCPGGGYYYENQ